MGLVSFLRSQKIRISKQYGFSLVELMVVVAIIGILASIAVPNYQRFQRKARQSEPKATLGGMFTAQKVFNTEWGFGTSDLGQMGFDLEAGSNPIYNTGWINATKGTTTNWNASLCSGGATCLTTANQGQYRGPTASNPPLANTGEQISGAGNKPPTMDVDILASFPGSSCNRTSGTGICAFDSTGTTCASATSGTNCGVVSGLLVPGSASGDSFNNISFTIGSIGQIGGSNADAWIMSDQKILRNVQNGL